MQTNAIAITSVEDLLLVKDNWDRLWDHSGCTDPTGRAEPIAIWLKHFASNRRFHAIVLESQGKFLAALPLIECTKFKCIRVGCLPNNGWALGASLLMDLRCEIDSLALRLIDALQTVPWKIVLLEHNRLERQEYQAFQSGLEQRKVQYSLSKQPPIGVIFTRDDWSTFHASLSKSRRKHFRTLEQKTLSSYKWKHENCAFKSVDEANAAIKAAFDIENRSWKNLTNSSVNQRGVFPYYLEAATYFVGKGELGLFFLELDGKRVAFNLGFFAKNAFHSYKIGYDPEFRRLGPGVFLKYLMLRDFCGDETIHMFDCIGDANETTQIWNPKLEETGQVVIGLRGRIHKALVSIHRRGWGRLFKANRVTKDQEKQISDSFSTNAFMLDS